jgi:antitoxin HicB
MRTYTVVLEWDQDAGEFSAIVPALPGCATFGATRAEALANAREAIAGYLEELGARGETAPADIETAAVEVAA